jgi:glycosyltransferase involved in cell wall biosynthesis
MPPSAVDSARPSTARRAAAPASAATGDKRTVAAESQIAALDRLNVSVAGPADVRTPRVSVVIPALNEARNLPYVFDRLPEDVFEVVLVDGASTDGTVEVARTLRPDVRVVRQTRRGKGNALACGFAACRGDIIVMIDADGSTDPREIPAFVAALLAGADYAKGSRFIDGGGSTDITRIRRAGNFGLNLLTNALNGTRFSDLCYGYNAFWRHCLPALDLESGTVAGTGLQWGDGFEIETIINVRVARAGLRMTEVPSFERPRLHGESNLNAVRDGLRVLRTIARERLRRTSDTKPAFGDIALRTA